MIKTYTKKATRAVTRTLDRLRREGNLRSLVSKGSQENLNALASWFPTPLRAFQKNLLRLERLAVPIHQIIVPEAMGEAQNRDLLYRLKEGGFIFKLIDDEGVLDLRRAGIRREMGYRDRTLEFEDVKVLAELREMLSGENLEVINQDPEVKELTHHFALWKIRIILYKIGLQKFAARKEEDETSLAESRVVMANLAQFLKELDPVKLSGAAALLEQGNDPATNAILTAATDHLEKQIVARERERLQRENRSPKRRPANILEEELVHLAQRRYRISFSRDGAWIIPETKLLRVGPALKRKYVPHKVPVEKLARREQHKIDEITNRIANNSSHVSLLSGIARILKEAETIDFERIGAELSRAYTAYEMGKVRPKFKAKLWLKLALDLVELAAQYREPAARRRLTGFAADMVRMAARQLMILNANLGGQLKRIAAKQKLEMLILAQVLERDANLQMLSESVLQTVTNHKIMNSARLAGDLRQLLVDARCELVVDEQAEAGILRSRVRIARLSNLLAKVRRLIHEKEKVRTLILHARERYKTKAISLKQTIDFVAGQLANIERINAEIAQALKESAKEAILIQQDVDHKHEPEEAKETDKIFGGRPEIFNAIDSLNTNYETVYAASGAALGKATPFDIWKLKLKKNQTK